MPSKERGVIRLEGLGMEESEEGKRGKAMQPSCTEPNPLDTKGEKEGEEGEGAKERQKKKRGRKKEGKERRKERERKEGKRERRQKRKKDRGKEGQRRRKGGGKRGFLQKNRILQIFVGII